MSTHPAGPADSAFLSSRRRMVRMGAAVIASGQAAIAVWCFTSPAIPNRGVVLSAFAASLVPTAIEARSPSGSRGVLAWMLVLALTTGVVTYGTGSLAGPAALLALPSALVASVILPPWLAAAVAVDQVAAFGLAAALGGHTSGAEAFLVAAIYALTCSLAVGLSMEQRRLLRARSGQALLARARARHIDDMLTVARALGDADDETLVVRRVLELVCGVTGAGGGVLARWDQKDGLTAIPPAWGVASRRDGESTLARSAYRSGATLQARGALAVPLALDGRRVGVLVVTRPRGGGFTASQVSRLEGLAVEAALVLEHAHRDALKRETNARLEELAQLKSDFVATVSHELRTPITTILGGVRTLHRPELRHPDEQAQRLLASVERQAVRLERLVEDLLTVSRVEEAAAALPPEATDIVELARAVIDETVASGGRHTAIVRVEPPVPVIECHRDSARRILSNLVENATKYTSHGEISITVSPTSKGVRVVVSDEGAGIHPSQQGALFERFSRLDPRAAKGTGLGLYIVKRMVETMGGWIVCCSDVGWGTSFGLVLPLVAEPAAVARDPLSAPVPA